jgi:hypothetical protein
MRWLKVTLSKGMRRARSLSGKSSSAIFIHSADCLGRLINSQSLNEVIPEYGLTNSDNGTDVYDSGEKQRIPAWTGKYLLIAS